MPGARSFVLEAVYVVVIQRNYSSDCWEHIGQKLDISSIEPLASTAALGFIQIIPQRRSELSIPLVLRKAEGIGKHNR